MTRNPMTANQLVAYNLKRAREQLKLTQEMAGQRLADYLGKTWSPASFSDAERSAGNGRTREFSANEILAFACVFGKPIAWFFTPPDDAEWFHVSDPHDMRRTIRRPELEERLQPLYGLLPLGDHVQDLRRIAEALEQADQAKPGAAPEIGSVGVPQFAPERSEDEEKNDG